MKCLFRVENPQNKLYKVVDVSKYSLDEVGKMVECYENAGFRTSIKIYDGKCVNPRYLNTSTTSISDNRASA